MWGRDHRIVAQAPGSDGLVETAVPYSRLGIRNSRRISGRVKSGPSNTPPAIGEGIDDPHEAETWDARLSLIEEQFMANAPEVDRWPPFWKAVARLNARSVRFARSADRVLHYRFPRE